MRKSRIIFVFGFVFILSVCAAVFVGCGSADKALNKPENLRTEGFVLQWDAVENAESYAISITNAPHKTTETNSLSLNFLENGRQYRIKVKAVGDEKKFADSEYSEEFVYYIDEDGKIKPNVRNVARKDDEPLRFEDDLPELTADVSTLGTLRLNEEQYLSVGTFDYYWTFEPEDTEHYHAVKGTISLTVLPAEPLLEDEVTVSTISEDALQVLSPQGKQFEYSLDGENWQNEPLFTDLEPNKDYCVRARLKETENFLASNSVQQETRTYGYEEILEFDSGTVTGIKDIGKEFTAIKIPDAIGGVAVTKIGAEAFADNRKLTYVTIPDSVKEIGPRAFEGCSNIAFMRVPFVGDKAEDASKIFFGYLFGAESFSKNQEKVPQNLTDVMVSGTKIGERAFYGCEHIVNISLEEGVEELGNFAFEKCSGLETVNLNMILRLNGSAFVECGALKQITVAESNTNFITDNSFLLTKQDGGKTLVFGCGSAELPKRVTTIAEYAFYKSPLVTEITDLPNLTVIEDYAFYCCDALKKVEASALQSIGKSAFESCGTLEELSVPSIQIIKDRAFYAVSALRKADISEAEEIGSYSFYYCSMLSDLTNTDSLKKIGRYAFYGCIVLSGIDLRNAEIIEEYAFSRCRALSELDLSEAISIESNAFGYCSSLNRVVFAEGVNIQTNAFFNCNDLTDLFYRGNGETEWNGEGGIQTAAGNDALFKGTWRYYSATRPAENPQRFWHYGENGALVVWE